MSIIKLNNLINSNFNMSIHFNKMDKSPWTTNRGNTMVNQSRIKKGPEGPSLFTLNLLLVGSTRLH
jgi:hypothetical protein